MAFPEYSSLCTTTRSKLAEVISESLHSFQPHIDSYDFNDPDLWHNASELCDVYVDRIEAYLSTVMTARRTYNSKTISNNKRNYQNGRRRNSGWDLLIGGLVDMEKSQITYKFVNVNNVVTEPFVPCVHNEKPYSLDPNTPLIALPGHGMDSKAPKDIIAPSIHYPHPYEKEIKQFRYQDWQLSVEDTITADISNILPCSIGIWIDSEELLSSLATRINNECHEVAIDLEAHSYRSFSGFVCLMQISLRRHDNPTEFKDSIPKEYDFLIDILVLRKHIQTHLAPLFSNPNIVKQ